LKGENSRHNPRKLGRPKRRGQESESCILAKKPRKTGWSGGGPVVQMRAKRRENGGAQGITTPTGPAPKINNPKRKSATFILRSLESGLPLEHGRSARFSKLDTRRWRRGKTKFSAFRGDSELFF
jgi:hypothetical protein